MSVTDLERRVLELSQPERQQFAEWFYEHETLFAPDLSHEMKTELLARKADYLEHPEQFRRVESPEALHEFMRKIDDEVRTRTSSTR